MLAEVLASLTLVLAEILPDTASLADFSESIWLRIVLRLSDTLVSSLLLSPYLSSPLLNSTSEK